MNISDLVWPVFFPLLAAKILLYLGRPSTCPGPGCERQYLSNNAGPVMDIDIFCSCSSPGCGGNQN